LAQNQFEVIAFVGICGGAPQIGYPDASCTAKALGQGVNEMAPLSKELRYQGYSDTFREEGAEALLATIRRNPDDTAFEFLADVLNGVTSRHGVKIKVPPAREKKTDQKLQRPFNLSMSNYGMNLILKSRFSTRTNFSGIFVELLG